MRNVVHSETFSFQLQILFDFMNLKIANFVTFGNWLVFSLTGLIIQFDGVLVE